MKTIASFTVNHDILNRGLYVSRIDGDVISYDLRMKKPNGGDYLSIGALHTLEHLLATFFRNSPRGEEVVYVGPMGCRTGFYLLLRDTVSRRAVIDLTKEGLAFAAAFAGEIPGNKRWECGNYLEHDLPGAKQEAAEMLEVLKNWNEEDMDYAQ